LSTEDGTELKHKGERNEEVLSTAGAEGKGRSRWNPKIFVEMVAPYRLSSPVSHFSSSSATHSIPRREILTHSMALTT